MKKMIICGAVMAVLGLLIAFGPQFLFKVCEISCSCCSPGGGIPICHWTARAEIGIGLLIAALGICMIVFTDPKTQLGLSVGTFMAGLTALFIPHTLIGGCAVRTMVCRKIAFPALTVESIIVIVFSAAIMVYIEMKKQPTT